MPASPARPSSLRLALVATALIVVGASAQAQVYVGGSAGRSQFGIACGNASRCERDGAAYKLFGGYMVSHQMALELSVQRQGTAAFTAQDPTLGVVEGRWRTQGVGAYGLLIAPYSNRFNVFGKLGFVNTRVTLEANSTLGGPLREHERHVNVAWGVGGGYDPTPSLGLRVEFERERVKHQSTKHDIDMVTASVLYRF